MIIRNHIYRKASSIFNIFITLIFYSSFSFLKKNGNNLDLCDADGSESIIEFLYEKNKSEAEKNGIPE
jgi:hypothetical protein